jgi:hypothetical protein
MSDCVSLADPFVPPRPSFTRKTRTDREPSTVDAMLALGNVTVPDESVWSHVLIGGVLWAHSIDWRT